MAAVKTVFWVLQGAPPHFCKLPHGIFLLKAGEPPCGEGLPYLVGLEFKGGVYPEP